MNSYDDRDNQYEPRHRERAGVLAIAGVERGAAVDGRADWSGVRDRVIAMAEAKQRASGREPSYPVVEPVLSAEEIAEVEAQYGVALPGEYRSFLAEVGAGGPGPELQLSSLCRIGAKWGWQCDGYPWFPDTSGPFTESEEWAGQQVRNLRATGYEPAVRDDDLDYLDDYRQVFGLDADEVWFLDRGRGAVEISDSGCGMRTWLIIVGPHRGELRFRDCDINPPFEPLAAAGGNPHTFYTWYIEWLERQEAAVGGRASAQDPALAHSRAVHPVQAWIAHRRTT
jgi:hypothetical protein